MADNNAVPLNKSQLDAFWNAEANLRRASLEEGGIGLYDYTHLIADERYVTYFNQYIDAYDISGEEIDALKAEVIEAHEQAVNTLDNIEFDGLQMQYYSSAQNFYNLIETENYDTLGAQYTAPTNENIFNGLGVTQPLQADILTEVTAPLEPEMPDNFPETPAISIATSAPEIQTSFGLPNLSGAFAKDSAIDTLPQIDLEPPAPASSAQTTEKTLASMSSQEIEEAIALASENGGGTYETYKAAFIAMEPDYQGFFDGVDAQTSALDFNPLRDELTEALNTNPSVAANMILIGRDPSRLEALTTMVTDDGNPLTYLRDEAEVSRLIHSFAEVNGNAPLSSDIEIQPLPEIVEEQINKIEAGHIDEAPSLQAPPSIELPDTDNPPRIENLKPGDAQIFAQQQSPNSCGGDFNNCVTLAAANINSEPNYQNYTVIAGDDLDSILQEQYGLEAGGVSYRASLIVAQANGLADPNIIQPGQQLKIPSLSSLQEIAGDDIRLQNLGSHPAELGQEIKNMMDEVSPAASQGAGYDYLNDARVAAAPITLG